MLKKLIILFLLLSINQAASAAAQSNTPHQVNYFGEPTQRTLLLGMWTTHLWTNQFCDVQSNNLIGFIDRGFFVGTFTNSFEHRSFAGGINRYWLEKTFSQNTQLQLGYRLGLVYGYEKGEVLFSSGSPVIPFIQLLAELSWKRVGIELSTTGQVVSAGFFFRF